MSVFDSELYAQDLEDRVEELEVAIEKALNAKTLEQAINILEEVY